MPSRAQVTTAAAARETASSISFFSAGVNLLSTKSAHSHPSGGDPMPIRSRDMCRRLFFDRISSKELEAHFNRLGLESSRAIREMVLPFFKIKAKRINDTPVAVAAAGKDYFFEFSTLQKWASSCGYDFLPFPDAAHNLLGEPDAFAFGETVCQWLEQAAWGGRSG